ncbi:MAG TPA: hypothetical protein ENH88_17020 [Pseudoalteromonas prydzensis]|uniref:Uncharacterized protein n=1 Tax=Pseudoalteromonas prydzensis TaxID=182141 RepID=A0A7V1D1E4_9GAMM|nr:hypothetical protein [Pseudoalteromonas prydzensis]HEA18107.1 hypothetical protein [Pseudoalteromonas prydzensis]
MIVFLIISLIIADYLFFGVLALLVTRNRINTNFEKLIRCAGCFTYNNQGKINYFSGSFSKVGFKNKEIIIGITKLSYHKKLSGIKAIEVKNYLVWKCLVINLDSGESTKIFCDAKQIKELGSYLDNLIV